MLVDAVMSRQVVSNCEGGHPLVWKSGHPCSLDITPASYFVDLGQQSQPRDWQCKFYVLFLKPFRQTLKIVPQLLPSLFFPILFSTI
jgi:hypothetical protein